MYKWRTQHEENYKHIKIVVRVLEVSSPLSVYSFWYYPFNIFSPFFPSDLWITIKNVICESTITIKNVLKCLWRSSLPCKVARSRAVIFLKRNSSTGILLNFLVPTVEQLPHRQTFFKMLIFLENILVESSLTAMTHII